MYRVGFGNDIHRLVEERKLVIGGVHIPFDKGCLGHSDGDPLLHAITDALLGAAALGDIGELFPDTDIKNKDRDSSEILLRAMELVRDKGFLIVNVDATIILENPKLKPYKLKIKNNLQKILKIGSENINLKAKTNEGLDSIGRGEAIGAVATVLLKR